MAEQKDGEIWGPGHGRALTRPAARLLGPWTAASVVDEIYFGASWFRLLC